MVKEFSICLIILILIIIGNSVTQGYCKNSIEDINEKLSNLREEVNNDKSNIEEINKKGDEIDKQWQDIFSKLAYYIEHEELEKVSKNIENIKTYINLEEYNDVTKEINEVIYILNHIEDKYSFNLQNIF